ncbi:MAG: hypothetical protein C0399_09020 [Syntrophus sp. (in: bacteria)]|nr:hypothetical protein [Syntrophus sp. (in: bacteria)]
MDHRDDYKYSSDRHRSGEPVNRQGKGPKKITVAAKAIRAITAIVVFGVPLAAGAATLIGYGVYKAYKNITGRS